MKPQCSVTVFIVSFSLLQLFINTWKLFLLFNFFCTTNNWTTLLQCLMVRLILIVISPHGRPVLWLTCVSVSRIETTNVQWLYSLFRLLCCNHLLTLGNSFFYFHFTLDDKQLDHTFAVFYGATHFNSDISKWQTSAVTDMSNSE